MSLRITSRQWKIFAHSENERLLLIKIDLNVGANTAFKVVVTGASTLLLREAAERK